MINRLSLEQECCTTGMQVVGLDELYTRMKTKAEHPIPFVASVASDSGGYFMLEAPDGVLLEVFEPGISSLKQYANITVLVKCRAKNHR